MLPNLLASPRGRRILFGVLYLTEGAPIGFLWWALPTVLREAGAPTARIATLLAGLALPWALKFLWAPLVDVLRGPRFGLRGWIVASQSVAAVGLVPLLWLDLEGALGPLAVLLLVHAAAAATADVAIDAMVISHAGEDERGRLNGWMNAGMLVGRSLFGAGALVLREATGDRGAVALLLAVLAAGVAFAVLYREPAAPARGGRAGSSAGAAERFGERLSAFGRHLRAALSRPATWAGLVFAAGAGAGFEAVGGLAGPLLVDAGLTGGEVGRFLGVPAVAAMVGGGLAGGWAADRVGRRPGVLVASLALAAAIFALALVGASGPRPALLAALGVVYLAIGVFTATSYALFMDLTDPRLGSTQFSAFMAGTNLCESWSVAAAGRLQGTLGYGGAFAVLAGASLLALAALPWMRPGRQDVVRRARPE